MFLWGIEFNRSDLGSASGVQYPGSIKASSDDQLCPADGQSGQYCWVQALQNICR